MLKREEWVRAQSTSLLQRLFGGRLAPLVAQFHAEQGLNEEDRAALRALLEQSEQPGRGKAKP